MRAFGCASRIAATAGSVCTTSPSELGLMIKMEFKFSTTKSSAPDRQSFRQHARKTGVDDLFLRGFEIVFQAALLHDRAVDVINAIRGAPFTITRLTDASDVN